MNERRRTNFESASRALSLPPAPVLYKILFSLRNWTKMPQFAGGYLISPLFQVKQDIVTCLMPNYILVRTY